MFGFKIIRESEYDRMVAEIYQRQASMAGSQSREETLQWERDEAQSLLATRTRQLDEAREETVILRTQWTAMMEERAEAQAAEGYHREQVSAYITSVTRLREQLDAAEEDLNEARAREHESIKAIDRLRTERDEARGTNHDAVTSRNSAEARVVELEWEAKKLAKRTARERERELADLRKGHTAETDLLRGEIRSLGNDLAALEKEKETLTASRNEALARLEKAQPRKSPAKPRKAGK